MKKTSFPLFLMTLMLLSNPCSAQPGSKSSGNIAGVWKGTSLCQQKNSPCKDETVVYHISKGKADNAYIITANKIVNGKEEEMGTLDFVYDGTKQTLTCRRTDRQNRIDVWEFVINNNKMSGTLMVESGLYRKIELNKE
jgi:hypothetical protein